MNTQRESAINAYIKQHPDSKLLGSLPVLVHGKVKPTDVFRLPINLLIFNLTNGRFAAELLDAEKKLGRELDPTSREDALIIRRFLLEQNEAETNALMDDLKKNGQLEPGIITFDGAVINANRRMAILQVLNEKTGDETFEYLNVARLPRGVDGKDLWRIEAKLQFGRDFRLEYGAVNELLKIRNGRRSGLSAKQISQATVGRYSERQVEEKLRTLKLMESYLEFIGKPLQYKTVQEGRITEHFNSLQGSVISSLSNSPLRNEIPKLTEIAFAMIEGGNHSHWKIRELKPIAELTKARKELFRVVNKKGAVSRDPNVISNAFADAQTEVANQKDQEYPEKLAKRARSALEGIDSSHTSLRKPEFQQILAGISIEVNRLSKAGGSSGKKARKS
jgi:hypothetical protein